MKQDPVSEEKKQQLSGLEPWKQLNESLALEKLVTPSKNGTPEDIMLLPYTDEPIVPNNNPFKKRKLDELIVLNDQTESFMELESVVTEVESSELLCVTPGSQQSVESKPIKTTEVKGRGKGEKKTKKVGCLSSEKKKSSILNFFPRV